MGSHAVALQSWPPRPLLALEHRGAHAHRRPLGHIRLCTGLSRRTKRCSAMAVLAPPPPPPPLTGSLESGTTGTLDRFAGIPTDSVPLSSSSSTAVPMMKKKPWSSRGRSATVEKSKVDLSLKKTASSIPETMTGGGGGDIGKKIYHGGGDGGDDGGDDDDYFGDFDEGDEGDEGGLFRRRFSLQELFDKSFVDAVLQEWYKTIVDLPAGIRQAYEMGLLSSAQMENYLATHARPTLSRFISRGLEHSLSRAFIGRMLADPAFLYKFLLEQGSIIACSLWWELKNRKGRIKQEWDLALANILTASVCNAFVFWSLASCRSYGDTFSSSLEASLHKLPNNIFERSYPLREFDLQKRVLSFFYKATKLFSVGLVAGSIQGGLSIFRSTRKEGRISAMIPAVSTNALGYGSFVGLYTNVRYQLLSGVDSAIFNHFDVPAVAVFLGTSFRLLNVHLGEISRHSWLGFEADPPLETDALSKMAYSRSSEGVVDVPSPLSYSSKWFISKNAIVSSLGFLGIKQCDDIKVDKQKRRRIVRKKTSTTPV